MFGLEGGELRGERSLERGSSFAPLEIGSQSRRFGQQVGAADSQDGDHRDVGDRELAGQPVAHPERLFELTFVLLYLYPRTAVLGAVLMTALLGGAMATHIRVGSPLFSHTLFGIYLAFFMWGGLWLRLPALRSVFPLDTRKD